VPGRATCPLVSQPGEVVDLDPGHDRSDGFVGRVVRVLEGVVTNLVTVAALWLIAAGSGLIVDKPKITATAVVVIVTAACTALAAWISRRRSRLWRLRAAVNWVNLSTPLGLAVGLISMGHRQAPDPLYRIIQVVGCRRLPTRGGFVTIGNALLIRAGLETMIRDSDLVHEGRHSTQYAFCGGLAAIPLYGAASLVSYFATGDWYEANLFEVRAGGIGTEGYSAPPDASRPIRAWVMLGVILCGFAAIVTSLITVLVTR
jgi:hypothetical protein